MPSVWHAQDKIYRDALIYKDLTQGGASPAAGLHQPSVYS